jgi:hypothetical protein
VGSNLKHLSLILREKYSASGRGTPLRNVFTPIDEHLDGVISDGIDIAPNTKQS